MAFTIHKKIYKQEKADDSAPVFKRQKNYAKKTVFIVDESSMFNESSGFGKSGLLTDLINYIFNESSNKLILIGDDAQLPPVGQVASPALDIDYLRNTFKLSCIGSTLTEVMRQEEESGILFNATNFRKLLKDKNPVIKINTAFADTYKMTGERLEDGIRYAYDQMGVENTAIICRSN